MSIGIGNEQARAWAEGYRMGVADERTSEANIGIAGFNAKVEPDRQNPYGTPQLKQEQDEPWLLNTAQNLAKFMAKNFYPEVTHWKVSDNLVSVILQIDNMVTGLIRKSKQERGEPVECKRCGGSGVIDDGEIDCYEDGTPYENGPIKCVKDCPDCTAPQTKEWVGLTNEEIEDCFDESCHLKVVDPKGGIKGSVNIFEVGKAIENKLKEKNHVVSGK